MSRFGSFVVCLIIWIPEMGTLKQARLPLEWCLLVFFSALVVTGCGNALVPVAGKVTVDGRPLASGWLRLHGDDDTHSIPTATITGDGRFQFETSGKRGVPPGTYRVVVLPGVEEVFASQNATRGAAPPQASSETSGLPRVWSEQGTTPLRLVVAPDRSDYSLELRREGNPSTP